MPPTHTLHQPGPSLIELVPHHHPFFRASALWSRALPLRVPVFSKDCRDVPGPGHLPTTMSSIRRRHTGRLRSFTATLIWASALRAETRNFSGTFIFYFISVLCEGAFSFSESSQLKKGCTVRYSIEDGDVERSAKAKQLMDDNLGLTIHSVGRHWVN